MCSSVCYSRGRVSGTGKQLFEKHYPHDHKLCMTIYVLHVVGSCAVGAKVALKNKLHRQITSASNVLTCRHLLAWLAFVCVSIHVGVTIWSEKYLTHIFYLT